MLGNEDLLKLIRFSKQYYTVEKYSDSLVFNDLRFGFRESPLQHRFDGQFCLVEFHIHNEVVASYFLSLVRFDIGVYWRLLLDTLMKPRLR